MVLLALVMLGVGIAALLVARRLHVLTEGAEEENDA